MDLIKNEVNNAKRGNVDSQKVIYDHYYYLVSKFFKMYNGKMSFEKMLELYNVILIDYFNTETVLTPSLFIHKGFCEYYKNNFAEKRELLSDLVVQARRGDKEARNKLIVHYSYLVTDQAQKYDYLDYEDLVQYGMIKLIETIDIQLKENNNVLFSQALIRAIDIYFSSTLKRQVEKINSSDEYIKQTTEQLDNELDRKIFEMEFKDILESKNLIDKDRLSTLKYYLEGKTLDEIKVEFGETKSMTHQRVKKITSLIQYYYNK